MEIAARFWLAMRDQFKTFTMALRRVEKLYKWKAEV